MFCETLLYEIKNFALIFTFPGAPGMKWITTVWFFCVFSLAKILFANKQFIKQLPLDKTYFKSSYTRNLNPGSGFKKGDLTGLQFLEGGCWEKGGDFFQRRLQFFDKK